MKTDWPSAIATALVLLATSVPAEPVPLADATASASVRAVDSPEGYRIAVLFRPVTTLDDASNEEMTEVMAHFYAEEALSGFLKQPKAISFVRAKSSRKEAEDGRVQWNFAIASPAISDAPVEAVEKREELAGRPASREKTDAKTRMIDFRSSCFKDLRIAEAVFSDEAAHCSTANERKALKDRIANALSALEEKIRTDDGLFRAEKKDMLDRVGRVRASLYDEIEGGGTIDSPPADGPAAPIADATFVEPFGALLRADPILLRTGGARIVERKDGSIVVLAVGSALAENGSREKIAEMQAAAALSRLRGEEVVTEDELTRSYERSTRDGATTENAETKRTSKTTLFSMDFHKPGETVGTWLSADRRKFFLAKGRILEKP